jgi:hypothetical protein
MLENVNNNAYKLKLRTYFRVSPTFSIVDLMPYLGEVDDFESWMTQM